MFGFLSGFSPRRQQHPLFLSLTIDRCSPILHTEQRDRLGSKYRPAVMTALTVVRLACTGQDQTHAWCVLRMPIRVVQRALPSRRRVRMCWGRRRPSHMPPPHLPCAICPSFRPSLSPGIVVVRAGAQTERTFAVRRDGHVDHAAVTFFRSCVAAPQGWLRRSGMQKNNLL